MDMPAVVRVQLAYFRLFLVFEFRVIICQTPVCYRLFSVTVTVMSLSEFSRKKKGCLLVAISFYVLSLLFVGSLDEGVIR